ncbi:hypothetical protein SAMN04487768_3000 [Burkholderia sp. b13]|nr:hypothetical protein SAMN04487768_3000 [Burkholderia sp. b13]
MNNGPGAIPLRKTSGQVLGQKNWNFVGLLKQQLVSPEGRRRAPV